MKRAAILVIAVLFTLCTVFPVSTVYAEPYDNPDPEIDTSWFDYKDLKKTYSIKTEAQLRGLASLVNEEQAFWKPNHTEDFTGVEFILKKDIKLKERWTPIGAAGTATSFRGTFNGNGHSITNLIVYPEYDYIGLFGFLNGTVKNLHVDGTVVSDTTNVGSIAGKISRNGSILKCSSTVTVNGKEKAGGIAGENEGGNIEDCANHGDVSGAFSVGGVVGENYGGTVTRCSNSGTIYSDTRSLGTYGTGGIAGKSVGSGSVIDNCFNKGKIKSATETTGGIVGYANASDTAIYNCYNTGDLAVRAAKKGNKKTKSYLGGIAGFVGTQGVAITNGYNTGAAHGADVKGGIIGSYYDINGTKPQTSIINNYYMSSEYKYGIGTSSNGKGANVQNCAFGIPDGSFASLSTKLGDAYMKDSNGLYGNGGYPVLRWQQPISEDEKEYIEGIPVSTQKRLDRYIQEHTDNIMIGKIVIDVFNTTNLLSESIYE